jgi:thiol-disulfide isomerase/thioredoxin
MKRLFYVCVLLALTIPAVYAQHIPAYTADKLMARASNKDTTYIINFWATWCGPCVAELPQFTKLQEHYAKDKVKVILVSLDFPDAYPAKLTAYVAKKKLQPEVVWFSESNANEFIPKIDNSWTGSLPGTMIVNKRQDYKLFLEKPITAEEIRQIIARIKS